MDEEKALAQQLANLGLSIQEATIFSLLIFHSPAGASFLARRANLARSSVYTTLNIMIGKGLVGVVNKNNVKQFVAEDFRAVEERLRQEQKLLQERIQKIQAIQKFAAARKPEAEQAPQGVVFFEGQEGLKRVYLSLLRSAPQGATLYVVRDEFLWSDEWAFTQSVEWKARMKRLKTEKRISTKLFLNNSTQEKKLKALYQKKKMLSHFFLPGELLKDFALYSLGDVTCLLSLEKGSYLGIKITHRSLARNFQTLLDKLV